MIEFKEGDIIKYKEWLVGCLCISTDTAPVLVRIGGSIVREELPFFFTHDMDNEIKENGTVLLNVSDIMEVTKHL